MSILTQDSSKVELFTFVFGLLFRLRHVGQSERLRPPDLFVQVNCTLGQIGTLHIL